MIDLDKLARLMAEFETGQGESPFELDTVGEVMPAVEAFIEQAKVDTAQWVEKLGPPGALQSEDARQSFVLAGFLQGLHIGYRYRAEEEVAA